MVFQGGAGQAINNIDVTGVLKPFTLAQYQLHQSADGGLKLSVPASASRQDDIRQALLGLFGADQALEIIEMDPLSPKSKLVQYTREAA